MLGFALRNTWEKKSSHYISEITIERLQFSFLTFEVMLTLQHFFAQTLLYTRVSLNKSGGGERIVNGRVFSLHEKNLLWSFNPA